MYNIAYEILDGGMCGVTSDRFLDFLYEAFSWDYENLTPEYSYNAEYGYFNVRV